MKTIEQLYNGFYLAKECANSQISNCPSPLRVAPIKIVHKFAAPEIDHEHFAFAEKKNDGQIEYFHGLKNFLYIDKSDFAPIFICDNHNHAITFRYNIIYSKKINNIELIHIDQHSDCRENKNHLKLNWKENEIEKVFYFCNEKCNVGNFIPPAIESGIITNQIQIRSSNSLQNLKIDNNTNYILDIDLDFCLKGINKNIIDQEILNLLKQKFYEIGKSALCTTIATSPFFLDENLAIDIINEIFKQEPNP